MKCRSTSVVALTSGDWVVLDEGLWVDSVRGLDYFTGLKETPLEKHLYVVSIYYPGQVRLLTHTGFSYKVEINAVSLLFFCLIKELIYFIYMYSIIFV